MMMMRLWPWRQCSPLLGLWAGLLLLLLLAILGSSVLQHHGRQPLLHLLYWPVDSLTGCVRLRQQHRRLKVQFVLPLSVSVHQPLLLLLLLSQSRGGCSTLDQAGAAAAPPELVQALVADWSLQAVSRRSGLFVCELESSVVLPRPNTNVTWRENTAALKQVRVFRLMLIVFFFLLSFSLTKCHHQFKSWDQWWPHHPPPPSCLIPSCFFELGIKKKETLIEKQKELQYFSSELQFRNVKKHKNSWNQSPKEKNNQFLHENIFFFFFFFF